MDLKLLKRTIVILSSQRRKANQAGVPDRIREIQSSTILLLKNCLVQDRLWNTMIQKRAWKEHILYTILSLI